MAIHKLKEKVYSVGAVDWDRRLFDELVPLPDGTSYNSYYIRGSEKSCLIDSVDPEKSDILFKNLETIKVDKLDYIVANHAEQDHSGAIPELLTVFPNAKVITNKKGKAMLIDLLMIEEERFILIEDGEKISLGDKTLEFIFTPWVHWPETMSTYLIEDKILFSCDFFGSHRATSSLFVQDEYKVIEDAKRYYAEIMMPFRNLIKKNIEKVEQKEIDIIAPSHGPSYNKPKIIIDAYKEWISDRVENKVLIPFVSMHESTKIMVEYLTDKLIEKGIEVIPMNLTKTDIGVLAMEIVDAATIVLGTPYVLAGAHPAAVYAAYLTNALRPKVKYLSIIGSYGWGGKAVDQIKSLLANVKAEFIEPVLSKGFPKEETYKALDNLAEEIFNKHKSIND
jgi:flavorubredoxin